MIQRQIFDLISLFGYTVLGTFITGHAAQKPFIKTIKGTDT